MTGHRSFLRPHDVQLIRRARSMGELCLWRARAALPERRAFLLRGALDCYVTAAAVVRYRRLRVLGQVHEARRVELRMATRIYGNRAMEQT